LSFPTGSIGEELRVEIARDIAANPDGMVTRTGHEETFIALVHNIQGGGAAFVQYMQVTG